MQAKRFLPIITALFISLVSFAQNKSSIEKIKSLKVAYFTEQLNLTEKEAVRFWPIYNKYDEARHDLYYVDRRNIKKETERLGGVDKLSEKQAQVIMQKMLSLEKAEYQNQVTFYKEVTKIISSKKYIKLQYAEREFNRKLFSRLRRGDNSKKQKRN